MSDKTLKFTDSQVENLLAYLERLVCYPEDCRFRTKAIREDVLSLMKNIESQAGKKIIGIDLVDVDRNNSCGLRGSIGGCVFSMKTGQCLTCGVPHDRPL